MRAAAEDIEAGGVTGRLFDGVDVPRGSVPTLRLMAALHHLVLDGRAAELEPFYRPDGAPGEAWPAALATLSEQFDWVRGRLGLTVQTNEPGRAAVLYAALLWLTERDGRPIRLLELASSAGLNLLVDRYCYVVGGVELGDAASPVRIVEPWQPGPPVDLEAASRRLRLIERAGCDLAPLDPADPEQRLVLLSYIWPDEPERLARTRAALDMAASERPRVDAGNAREWLEAQPPPVPDTLTVVWHSVFRQYLPPGEWEALEAAHPDGAVWLAMEPGYDHMRHMTLTVRSGPGEPEQLLAMCGDHGAPVEWQAR